MRLCSNCEEHEVSLYCSECRTSLCTACDSMWHTPAKKRNHGRRARFNETTTDMLIQAEKEGSVSEFVHSRNNGVDQQQQQQQPCLVKKYKLESDDGDWHVWKNGSKETQLDSLISFELNNMQIIGFEGKTQLKLCLPPQSIQYLFIQCVDGDQEFSCELSQRFSLKPARFGALPSIVDANIHNNTTTTAVLQAATKSKGSVMEFSGTDNVNVDIIQYYFEFNGGCCYLYENDSKDVLFAKQIEYTFENLRIDQCPEDQRQLSFEIKPGQSYFIILREIDLNKVSNMSMQANYTISYSK